MYIYRMYIRRCTYIIPNNLILMHIHTYVHTKYILEGDYGFSSFWWFQDDIVLEWKNMKCVYSSRASTV